MKSPALLLAAASIVLMGAQAPTAPVTPNDIVAAAPASAWRDIPPGEVLIFDLKSGGRFVVQLAPEFAPIHVANIQALAQGRWWNGAAIYRVQDNYVAQWGNNESDKPFPASVVARPPAEYTRALKGLPVQPLGFADPYAAGAGFSNGWPIAYSAQSGWANLAHCYGTVGVGRGLAPDTGTGGELYAIIGHGPRQLDRNIAVVGRVIEGIELLSSLKRGPAPMGFYANRAEDTGIAQARLASELVPNERPSFQYMDTTSASFAQYLKVRANRKDAFYETPAGGVDLCNVPVPVRRAPPTGERG